MKTITSALVAACLLCASSFAAAAVECSTDTPLSVLGADGVGNGLIAQDGAVPSSIGDALTNGSLASQVYNGGNWQSGVAHLNGTATCPDYPDSSAAVQALASAVDDALHDSQAVSAALATPIWLEQGENFAVSGGVGFTDGSAAFGMTGVMRLGHNVAGYAGGAISANDTNYWAGKAGLRLGW